MWAEILIAVGALLVALGALSIVRLARSRRRNAPPT